ncbi:type II toxin-antitoxin system HipA family toxin [Photobacterium kishitanii]|uniref:type II toxin-antitoxin system HipA family toxin n=1 Tax=Photobacterium kishitanii TaxID=318456 RepID=UPI0005D4099C|nr:type II toxin-antitoxin system HipA family toxin [Photobacterium kishitanii]KJG10737.1 serine/threonine protein kinase [Photobacterium kishitanii]PSV08074.1 type II toxin-antitoxin system HipA family toxin [Photobacterium kishitanii]PSV17473.1 type II toxin-antitoxin system HipA family toxin [Photobacterium kishitanii]PSV75460.1 type II toxin-antitoxin system HipA family toxin [Photobacterium kishitanii]
MERLSVAMNGILVGTLSKASSGAISFQYHSTWLTRAGSRAISLSMPLRHDPYHGDIPYNFFDNLLPDNEEIRSRIQSRFKAITKRPFDLLSKIGGDCVGAIQLYSPDVILEDVRQVHAEPLTDTRMAQVLRGYQSDAPLGMLEDMDDFRISIAGAQEKTGLLWYQNQWHLPLGSTPTSHILKLPIGILPHKNIDLSDSCENEWLCLKIAAAYGFSVNEANIVYVEDIKALALKRFDRRWSQDGHWLMRLPQEDMCQALGVAPALKYESDGGPGISNIMQFLLGSRTSSHDREVFFKAQILFWLLAAIDGHGKNFSLFLEPESRYSMTPLYDIISAYPLMDSKSIPKQKAKMAMALIGTKKYYKWQAIQPRHFLSTAKAIGFSEQRASELMAEMKSQTPTVINTVRQQLPKDFPDYISESIFNGVLKQAGRLPESS